MTLDPTVLADLRKQHHVTRLYLAVYHPAAMVTARVVGTPAQGATTITVGTVTTYKTPFKHALVYFGSSAGACDIGIGQIKSFSSPTLVINSNNFQLANDDYVTILEEIKPEALVCNTDNVATLENDNEAYVDENSNYKPLARMGTPMVAFLDGATVTLNYWSDSIAVAPAATLTGYAWTFPGGTPGSSASPGTALVPVSVVYNAYGQHYHSLEVTDSNGKVHTGYRPTFIFNRQGTPGVDAPFAKITIDSVQANREQGGWTLAMTVRDTANQTYFPDRAQVILFAEDWYDGVKVSRGGQRTYSENIVFVGYIHSGSVKANVGDQTVSFEASGLGSFSNDLTGDAVDFERQATSTDWHVLVGQTPMLAAYHLLTEHCTFDHLCDLHLDGLSYAAQWVDAIEGSIISQLQDIAKSVRGVVGTSAQGLLWISTNPNLQDVGDRTDGNVLVQQAGDLIGDVEITNENQIKKTKQVDFSGVAWTGTQDTDFFSVATDLPYSNAQMQTVDNVRCANSQADSNNICGHYLAQANNRFPETVFHWRGNWRVFDCFPFENVQINVTAAENKRGIIWTNQKFYRTGVSYNYQNGSLMVSTTEEMETIGLPGFTGDYPSLPPDPIKPHHPPILIIPPPPPPPPHSTKYNLVYVATNYKGVAKCTGAWGTNGTDGAPIWSAVNNGLTSGTIRAFNLDPWSVTFNPITKTYAYARAFIVRDDGVWRCDGLPNSGVWTKVLSLTQLGTLISSASPAFAYTLALSTRQVDFIAVIGIDVLGGFNNRYYFCYSTNRGATWSKSAGYLLRDLPPQVYGEVQSSSHTNNVCYWSMFTDTPHYVTCFKIPDTTSPGFTEWQRCSYFDEVRYVFPYCDPSGQLYAADTVAYWYGGIYPNARDLHRIDTSITVPTINDGVDLTPGDPQTQVYFNPFNENYIYTVPQYIAPAATNRIKVSSNRGSSWTDRSIVNTNFHTRSLFPIGNNHNVIFATGEFNSPVAIAAFSSNFGANWTRFDTGASTSLVSALGMVPGDIPTNIMVDLYQT